MSKTDEIKKRWQEATEDIRHLLEENEKLRGALRFYANSENYDDTYSDDSCPCCITTFPPAIDDDYGEIARKALGEVESHE